MSGTWSQRVEQRYFLQLPQDVRAWLDQLEWERPGGAEFCRAMTPRQLLDPEPGTIWAGFMMPDTLPIVGNDYGDWLCLRIAADGSVSEVIHWSHCGGDWIPYGCNLAEALLYDAAQQLLHPHRPHVADVELPDEQIFAPARWASRWLALGEQAEAIWHMPTTSAGASIETILDLLDQWRVADFAVRRDRVLQHLASPLKKASDSALAQRLGVPWEPDFVRWLFDTQLIPDTQRDRLQQALAADGQLFEQDWEGAEREALAVIGRRRDLGWAFDVAGWAAQRRGEWERALQHYLAGINASWFSDETVRFRTHWFEEGYGKFAASQLAKLAAHLTDQQRGDSYLSIYLDNDPTTLRARVHDHWMSRARDAEQRQDFRRAYQFYYRAGWDLGLQPIDGYEEIYNGLRRTAKAANTPALAAVAEMHQRFLSR